MLKPLKTNVRNCCPPLESLHLWRRPAQWTHPAAGPHWSPRCSWLGWRPGSWDCAARSPSRHWCQTAMAFHHQWQAAEPVGEKAYHPSLFSETVPQERMRTIWWKLHHRSGHQHSEKQIQNKWTMQYKWLNNVHVVYKGLQYSCKHSEFDVKDKW